jgi:hypothetical protein
MSSSFRNISIGSIYERVLSCQLTCTYVLELWKIKREVNLVEACKGVKENYMYALKLLICPQLGRKKG